MRVVLIIVAVVALLFVLDRFALWLEARGWLFYRRRQPYGSTASNALLNLHAIWEPDRAHVVEERTRLDAELQGDRRPPPPT